MKKFFCLCVCLLVFTAKSVIIKNSSLKRLSIRSNVRGDFNFIMVINPQKEVHIDIPISDISDIAGRGQILVTYDQITSFTSTPNEGTVVEISKFAELRKFPDAIIVIRDSKGIPEVVLPDLKELQAKIAEREKESKLKPDETLQELRICREKLKKAEDAIAGVQALVQGYKVS